MTEYNTLFELIKNDNTNKIKYVILFFVFFIGLSQNLFHNLFGCHVQKLIKQKYVKHIVSILFLFLLMDINAESVDTFVNPLYNLIYTLLIYGLAFLLLHSNKIYFTFIAIIIFILIILDKFKSYYENTIHDQEELQQKLDLIYKTNNVFAIIIILTIIIGTLTSLNKDSLRKTLFGNFKSC